MTMYLLGLNVVGIRAIYEVIVITFANAQTANPAVASGASPDVDSLELFSNWMRNARSCRMVA